MAVFTNIHAALNTRLSSIAGSPAIAWPNIKFNSDMYKEYLRPTLMPATTALQQIDGLQKHQGIYQIDIFVIADKGLQTITAWQDAIITHFKGQSLTAGADTVHVQAVGAGRCDRDGAWYRSFVEIYYICYSN